MISKVFLLLSLTAGLCQCIFYNDTPFLNHLRSDDVSRSYFLNYYNPWYNQTIQFIETLSLSAEVSQICRSSLKRWLIGLDEKEAWAIKFLEATGKTVNGKLTGRNANFGSFSFCTNFTRSQAERLDFDGKYCLLSVQTKEAEVIRSLENYRQYYNAISDRSKHLLEFNLGNAHGVCVPSNCEIGELASAANKMLKPLGFSVLPSTKCTTTTEPEPLTNLQLLSFSVILIFAFFCALSLFVKNDFLSHFSPVANLKIIYNMDLRGDSKEKAYLHGAKALMLISSVTCHSFLFMGVIYFAQPFGSIKELGINEILSIYLERFLPVASQLFFVGGFFSMTSWFDVIQNRSTKFTFWIYLVARYIRIVIISIPIMLLFFILPHLGSGPYYSQITNHLSQNCAQNGHKVFFLSTNLKERIVDMCTVGNWYLSADFQIYTLNYFLIFYLVTKPRLGFSIALLSFGFSALFNVAYNIKNDMPAFFNTLDFDIYDLNHHQDVYFPFWFHYNSYLIGVLCGYFCKTKGNTRPRLMNCRPARLLVWALLSGLSVLSIYYPHYHEQNNLKASKLLVLFYPVVDKLILSLTLAWMFYSVSCGHSSPIHWFVSLKVWIPISRLGFSLSLCQFVFIAYSFALTRSIYNFNSDSMAKEILLNCIGTFLLGNLIFVLFEGPMISMFKRFKRRSLEAGGDDGGGESIDKQHKSD